MMVTSLSLLESEAAPLACGGSVLVSPVQLDVLDGVAQAQFMHTGAASSVAIDLNHGEGIDQLLSV